MKTLQNNFTTPEQSKRLLELGVPADSADCYFLSTDGIITWVRGVADKYVNWFGSIDRTPIPCWSAGRLIEILCICYQTDMQFRGYCRGYMVESLINTYEDLRYEIDFSELEE